jgi:hypothetical protein
MAPSRSGHSLDGPTFERLAAYAGETPGDIAVAMDFVNLLADWPGEAASPKWDAVPDEADWALVGQRAALLQADLMERPRRMVVGLGNFVRHALCEWWGWTVPGWLEVSRAAGREDLAFSPHPAGTNMWWNDPSHRSLGEAFWRATAARSLSQPLPTRKVPLMTRTRWLVETVSRFNLLGWPEGCVDWPFVDPQGRPQALSRGHASPAAHVVLDLCGHARPSREHQALHSCDRGEHCVSGAHLRWGTELDNRLDMVERGRGSIGKVGLDSAREIVREFDRFIAQQAREHDVTRDAILGIALGKSWDPSKWTRRL